MHTTALITGASSGIGAEFAAQLAARGHDLVLVARSADRLAALADRLGEAHGVNAHVLVQDLAEPNAAHHIGAELADRGLTVDMLVNNAGFGTCGRFEDIDGQRDHDQLMVNIVSLVDLTHELLPGMLARGRGSVINVASTAAFQPTPYFAVYGASKTFVLNFSLALRQEYRRRGIRVLALCPGPVETGFFDVIGTRKAAVTGAFSLPEPVVRSALRALDADRAYITPGLSNAVNAHLAPRRPRTLVAAIAERLSRGVRDAHKTPQRTAA
ncbi:MULTISPECIES: SDR family oxidoreductase [unclassified Streptomyces]|uniref:SDR family NAD(P)-dependent oxidoreductase n=1 Tax=unclassified Streptomyces TaxID=2593676 RepID=UPI001BE9CB9F|nr:MULTISPECIES: SDR family oxidoreductase [unclassified Streptomyces]MBT2407891.1 SDR family oxidoreductase [Streptomyces sp. ISL-21]MBT2608419.1 SDR family oxidoreductase [Streptomyces sp. ISL-87]